MGDLPRIRPRIWETFPDESRMADGLADRMERIRTTGDGQIPIVAAAAFAMLAAEFK